DEREDRRQRAEGNHDQALRDRRRELDPGLAEREERKNGQADEEDELAERARMPADHAERERAARLRARVPVGERRDREHEARDQRQQLADRPEPSPDARVELVPERPWRRRGRAREGLRRLHWTEYGD